MSSSIVLADVGRLESPKITNYLRRNVSTLLGRPTKNFPGSQPVTLSRKHFNELESSDYWLFEKSDGIRCMLYLTRGLENNQWVEQQYLIDRRNDYYSMEGGCMRMPCGENNLYTDRCQNGTLLDGELVLQRINGGYTYTYLVFDCLAINGENITSRQHSFRRNKLRSLVIKPWKTFCEERPDLAFMRPFQLELKTPLASHRVRRALKDVIPTLPHGNDGLIFVSKRSPYTFGTDQHTFKWKAPNDNTVDFLLNINETRADDDDRGTPGPDSLEFQLHVYLGGQIYQHFANLSLSDTEMDAMMGAAMAVNGSVLECYRDETTGMWRPKLEPSGYPRIRSDKLHGNHVSVVSNILESIQDGVTEDDLIKQALKMKTAYKMRHPERPASPMSLC